MILTSYTDIELFSLVAKGNEAAFKTLYERYWEKMFVVAANQLEDLPAAQELVQDVWLDIWNRREGIRLTGEIKNYLAVAVKYRVINEFARRKRNRDYQRHAALYLSASNNYTQEQLGFDELKEQLGILVSSLPEKCRITYQLSREKGLSNRQIANAMNISEKAVERNLTRALKSIREGLKGIFRMIIFIFL